ncbi:SDR family NAD(P)-dependent oxidoreductase [Sphingomonas sp. YL-JM2C]
MDFKFRYGPWALVAGASEGTGASFARQLAARGLNLILVARRVEPLTALSRQIETDYGVDCMAASIDLTQFDAADKLAAIAGDREVGLLVLNAGADATGARFLDTELVNWEALVMRNVMTVMRACYRFGGPMRDRKRGGILLCGSGACYAGFPGIATYAGTKAFDLIFGEALWGELQPHGVDVLNLIMGRTDTPAHREIMARQGLALPPDCASADDVATLGIERLPHGPVCNWGLDDSDAGFAGISAADRRRRIAQIAQLAFSGKDTIDE